MGKLFLVVCVLACAFPLFRYEWNRFHELYQQTRIEWNQNHRILHNDLCYNAVQRLHHGKKVSDLCERAERENRLDPKHRAYQQWWRTSEYVALYHRVAGTWYMVLGIVLFTIVTVCYFVTQYVLQSKREKHYFDAMSQFVHRLTAPSTTMPMDFFAKSRKRIHYPRKRIHYR